MIGKDDFSLIWQDASFFREKDCQIIKTELKYINVVKTIDVVTDIEEHTEKIKRKLQCSYKYEIHSVAVEYGITHIL